MTLDATPDSGEPTPPDDGIAGWVQRLLARPGAYRVLVGLIVAGILARVALMGVSLGSSDILTWNRFARLIQQDGIWAMYRDNPIFNHPPLMGWLAAGIRSVAVSVGIPFRILFKLPCLLADGVVMWVLWQHFRPRGRELAALVVALFAWNPVSILLTGHHGNTDPLLGTLVLLSATALWKDRPLLAGLLAAAAANVKISALLVAPGLFLLIRGPRPMARFVGGYALGMTPFLLPLTIVPAEFLQKVVGYKSFQWRWGFGAFLLKPHAGLKPLIRPMHGAFVDYGRHIVILAVLAWAYVGRRVRFDPFRAAALALTAFMVFTPGFGIQYLVWFVPVLAVVSPRVSARYAVTAGLFAFLVYAAFWTGEFPLRTKHAGYPSPAWVVGLFAWATLVAFQWESGKLAYRRWREG